MGKRHHKLHPGEYERRILENDEVILRAVLGGKYEVTKEGDVYSLRNNNKRKLRQAHVLGYRKVTLFVDGERKMVSVHRMMAVVFLGKPESPLMQVNHISGNKSDNRIENIEWTTPKQNVEHATSTGLRNNLGKNCNLSVLNDEMVISILTIKKSTGKPNREIAEEHGVSETCVEKVIRGDSWAHVAPEIPRHVKEGNRLAGDNHPRAKITRADVLAIRDTAPSTESEYQVLADKYGISPSHVRNITLRNSWKSVV